MKNKIITFFLAIPQFGIFAYILLAYQRLITQNV